MLSSHPSDPTFISCWQKVLAVSPLEELHATIEKMSNSVCSHITNHQQHFLIWCIRHLRHPFFQRCISRLVMSSGSPATKMVLSSLPRPSGIACAWMIDLDSFGQCNATFPTRFDVISFLRQTETFIVHKHTTHSPKKPSSSPIPIHPLGAHLTKPLISLGAPCSPLLSWLRPLPRLPFISLL